MRAFILGLAFVCTVSVAEASMPVLPAFTTVEITCEGDYNACYTYFIDGVGINVPGDPVTVIIDGKPSSVCPNPAVSSDNIFIHQPGSSTAGIGYVDADVCANPGSRTAQAVIGPTTVVYTDFASWYAAAH